MILITEPRQQKQQQQQLQERRTKSAITKKWKETDNSRWWQDIQNSAESAAKPISFIWKTSFYGKVSEFTGSANYCKLSSLWSSQVREGLINVEIITANVLSCRPSGTPMSQHCPPSTNNIPFLYTALQPHPWPPLELAPKNMAAGPWSPFCGKGPGYTEELSDYCRWASGVCH